MKPLDGYYHAYTTQKKLRATFDEHGNLVIGGFGDDDTDDDN